MYNREAARTHFSRLLQFKTVSGFDDEFEKLHTALNEMYPELHKKCEFKLVNDKGLMFRWIGNSSEKCIVLASHYDVVPASDEDNWTLPPFSGEIIDGKIWGRGTLDTKCTFCAILESAEALIKSGFTPKFDVYMCFGGDEETTGKCAVQMANLLKGMGKEPFLVLDEGGAVVNEKIAGINRKCALVGIAEKGYMDIEFYAKGMGGHSSISKMLTPVSVMAEVIRRIDRNPFKPNINEPLKIMIDFAKKYASFKYKAVLSTYKIWRRTKFIKRQILSRIPEVTALTKTTGSITQITGGSADNVIANRVRAVGNFRIINGSSVNETLNVLKNVLKDLPVEMNIIEALEPSPISEINGEGFDALSIAINKTWDNSVIIPFLMLARSDSRSYSEISKGIYRFSPIILNKQQRDSIHGTDENIPEESFYKIIEFYICLLNNL